MQLHIYLYRIVVAQDLVLLLVLVCYNSNLSDRLADPWLERYIEMYICIL